MAANSIKFLHINLKHKKPTLRPRNRVDNPTICMKMEGGEWRQKRRVVDENMIVLRKRIHEMKMKEENYAPPSTSKWWAWEKKWYKNYGTDVVEIVGLLQISVMNARPTLVLGAGAFLVITMVLAMYAILSCMVGFVGLAIF